MNKLPLFILGVNTRSGTNYLFHLLVSHPDCIASNHNGEDYIINESDLFFQYFEKVTRRWDVTWKNTSEYFLRGLEQGLISYLKPEKNCKIYVSKTPNSKNLENFPKIISKGYLIIIVRSGQDVAESYIKTFNSRTDDAIRSWERGARSIISAIEEHKILENERVRIVKYEDLYADNKSVMTQLLNFLQLDVSKFDFNKSKDHDVVGSAVHRGDSKEVTWQPVPKGDDFNPLSRSSGWSRWKHYRFNWMAGELAIKLGYDLSYKNKTILYFLFNIFATVYDFIYRSVRWVFLRFLIAHKN